MSLANTYFSINNIKVNMEGPKLLGQAAEHSSRKADTIRTHLPRRCGTSGDVKRGAKGCRSMLGGLGVAIVELQRQQAVWVMQNIALQST
jgi:hypothetical protein